MQYPMPQNRTIVLSWAHIWKWGRAIFYPYPLLLWSHRWCMQSMMSYGSYQYKGAQVGNGVIFISSTISKWTFKYVIWEYIVCGAICFLREDIQAYILPIASVPSYIHLRFTSTALRRSFLSPYSNIKYEFWKLC